MTRAGIYATLTTLAIFACLSAGVVDTCSADELDGIRLLQNTTYDAPRSEVAYVEGSLRYQDYDNGSSVVIGPFGAINAGDRFEIGGYLPFESFSPDGNGDGTSGLLDPELFGRYIFDPIETDNGSLNLTAGTVLSLPLGDEDLGAGTFDVAGFIAGRLDMVNFAPSGYFGLRINGDQDFGSGDDKFTVDGQLSVLLGFAAIVPIGQTVAVTSEFDLETGRVDGDDSTARLTPGIDALVGEQVHLRGGVGIGLTNGAPDLELIVGVAADL